MTYTRLSSWLPGSRRVLNNKTGVGEKTPNPDSVLKNPMS